MQFAPINAEHIPTFPNTVGIISDMVMEKPGQLKTCSSGVKFTPENFLKTTHCQFAFIVTLSYILYHVT